MGVTSAAQAAACSALRLRMRGEEVHRRLHAAAGERRRRRASGPSRTPASAAISVRSLQSPRWPMRNMRPLTLPRPVPSDRSKRSWISLRTRVGVDACGRDHAGQHRRIHGRVGALDRQAPGAHRGAHALGPALVAREHRGQPLLEQHVERLASGRTAGWCSACTASSRSCSSRRSRPRPRRPWAASPSCSPRAPSATAR